MTLDQVNSAGGRNEIPVQRFIEVRTATAPAFSPDGQTLYFLMNMTGVPQIWSQSSFAPWPKQLSFSPDRVMSFHVSPDGQRICVSADMSGTENAQLLLMDPEGLNLQDVSQDPNHIYQFGGWSNDGLRISYASNRRNGRNFDLYIYDVTTNTHRLVHESDFTNRAHRFAPDGRSVLMSRSYTNLNNDFFLVDTETGELQLLTPHADDAHYTGSVFSPDGGKIYLLTDENHEFSRVMMMNLEDKTRLFLTQGNWDAEALTLSADGSKIAFTQNEDGTSQLYVMAVDGLDAEPRLVEGLPDGVIDSVTWHPDNATLALSVNSPLTGPDIWTVDCETGTVSRVTFAAVSGIPTDAFHVPELIHYPTFDGREIPAYYYRPLNSGEPHAEEPLSGGAHSEERLSVIVYVHGGPESQSRNDFNPMLQYFVNQGYAVLVPNVRGSSGYGRTYVHLDDVRKRMDSVADLAQAVPWLIEHGNAHPKRIAVMGRSYGGFMVLAAVTHYPDLWAAGVDIVGIANFRTFMENTSPYRRHLREPEYGTIEADGEFFDEIAPAHRVGDIQCPMFVTHGANDPRVPIGEAEGMVAALQARKHPVEYVRLEDEGHGVVKLKNRIRVYGAIADFLNRYVAGDK